MADLLQPHPCIELARIWPSPYKLAGGRPVNDTCPLWDLPGLQQLDMALLADMLQGSIIKCDFWAVPKLLSFSAGAHLPPASICMALQQLCVAPLGVGHQDAFKALLSLPAVQDISEYCCHALLTAVLLVVQTPGSTVQYLELLLERVPAFPQLFATQLLPDALKVVTLAAAREGHTAMLLRCLDHAQAVSLPSELVCDMLQGAAVTTWVPSVTSRLQSLPCGQLLQPTQLLQVLELCVCYVGYIDPVFEQWLAFEPVRQLPAAWLTRLLVAVMASAKVLLVDNWRKMTCVLELPGAQRLSAGEIATVVDKPFTCMSSTGSSTVVHCQDYAALAFAMAVLELPGAKGMTADSAAALASNCMVRRWRSQFECILKLPCAATMSLEQVKPWLLQAMFTKDQALFARLAHLPAIASAGGEDVRLWLDIMGEASFLSHEGGLKR